MIYLLDDSVQNAQKYLNQYETDIIQLEKKHFKAFLGSEKLEVFKCVNCSMKELLENVKFLIVHDSWLKENKVFDNFKKNCKDLNIVLVSFSGGISNVVYADYDELKLMFVPRYLIYKNMKEFVQNYTPEKPVEPMRLAYGKNWKLNTRLEERRLIWRTNEGAEEKLPELTEKIKKYWYDK